MNTPTIGFIGQGWIGRNYADDFERRGYHVVRYALEEPYRSNKEYIKVCDIVFIAVPTPTTPQGFDSSIVEEAVALVGKGKTIVIKSTILPGTTKAIQEKYPDVFVLHSPEFLTEATAAHDAAHPERNIVGIPVQNVKYREKAEAVLATLPQAPYETVCTAEEAELLKYASNCLFYFKIIFINLLHDLSEKFGGDWETIREGMRADSRVGVMHLDPVHKSGRGAGGHCFIKDFSAFIEHYERHVGDDLGIRALRALERKNIDLLKQTAKDLDILASVYGEEALQSVQTRSAPKPKTEEDRFYFPAYSYSKG